MICIFQGIGITEIIIVVILKGVLTAESIMINNCVS